MQANYYIGLYNLINNNKIMNTKKTLTELKKDIKIGNCLILTKHGRLNH